MAEKIILLIKEQNEEVSMKRKMRTGEWLKSLPCFSAFLIAFFVLAEAAQGADIYKIDPEHTSISFRVRHMVINKVRGRFDKFSGVLVVDEKNLKNSSVSVTIDARSIDTDHEKRDKHLRSKDFLYVEKYPEITFVSKEIRKTKKGYVAKGKLTIRGVTRTIKLPFKYLGKITDPWGNVRIGIEAHTTINRKDFGINYNKLLDNGGLVVGNKVQIEINLEAIKKK